MCLIFISNGAVASTNNEANKANNSANVNNNNNSTTNNNNNNNAESKSENVDPKMEPTVVSSPVEEENNSEVANDGTMYIGQKPDSTNINSVSKFNFIFYFIYKLKYDEDPNGVGHMNYEF